MFFTFIYAITTPWHVYGWRMITALDTVHFNLSSINRTDTQLPDAPNTAISILILSAQLMNIKYFLLYYN